MSVLYKILCYPVTFVTFSLSAVQYRFSSYREGHRSLREPLTGVIVAAAGVSQTSTNIPTPPFCKILVN